MKTINELSKKYNISREKLCSMALSIVASNLDGAIPDYNGKVSIDKDSLELIYTVLTSLIQKKRIQ